MVHIGDELRHAALGAWQSRKEISDFLRNAYCGTIGFEIDHLDCEAQRRWWQKAAELPRREWAPVPDQQRLLYTRLLRSTLFEQMLGMKFPSSKRFGLNGCEALVPGIFRLCSRSMRHGVRSVEVGMAHRGRLNVLSNVLGKKMGLICAEMKEDISEFHVGDLKYHQGISGTLEDASTLTEFCECGGDVLRLTIAPNPSHLEAVNAVVLGRVRAAQDRHAAAGDGAEGTKRAMGLLIHGDAAFAGLGISLEAAQLASLHGYGTGGTVHIVLNNQIGFTTEPHEARSSPHPSDFAIGLRVPVLHVNADDVEAVDRVFALAADWRAEFGRDVIIDFVGYRRFGHNELDDPEVTQPTSYSLVKDHPTVMEIYKRQLVESGVLGAAEAETMRSTIMGQLEAEYGERHRHRKGGMDWLLHHYGGPADVLFGKKDAMAMPQTGLPLETLQRVANVCSAFPEGFTPHLRVAKMMKKRKEMCRPGGRVDFATAETLAFGTILLFKDAWTGPAFPFHEKNVRLSGQDSRRGTFNQRHACFVDMKTSEQWVPLDSISAKKQARFRCFNSPLSEMAVLAFEYGYSLASPETLVCWEAQFGDFANNAQVAIDQFIASGEQRWGQTSSITLLLPHGFDGQGPDHSSARLERFLQLVNDDPDYLPGATPEEMREFDCAFDVLDSDRNGHLEKEDVIRYLSDLSERTGSEFLSVEEAWAEMRRGCEESADHKIDRAQWRMIMQQWYRRIAESRANIVVVNVTTPAQYFHVLRRQAHRLFRKPLIVMAPKYLLHHVKATSAFEDMGPGTFFRRVIVDYNPFGPKEGGQGDNTRHLAVAKSGAPLQEHPDRVRRLIICSGQVYYTLSHARRSRKIKDIAILRLEQIAPFPHDRILEVISFYPNADVVWCQEEPKNMGAWFYVRPRLATALRAAAEAHGRQPVGVRYVGRPVAAATATASMHIHQQETRHFLDEVLTL